MYLIPHHFTVSPNTRIVFFTVIASGYLTMFAHCLLRLVYSRYPSWLLYTVGFCGLSCSGILGVMGSAFLKGTGNEFLREWLELFRSALVPGSVAMLLFAAHTSRIRAREHRSGVWKAYLRAGLLVAVLVFAWEAGGGKILADVVRTTKIEPHLVVYITSITALLVLLHGARKTAALRRDEIVLPVYYWCVAMSIASILSLVSWNDPQRLWLQIAGMELAGVTALVVGLSLENERAHRDAAQQMADLKAMQNISWSLVGATSLEELSSAFACAISDGFHAAPVVVYLSGENEEELIITAVCGSADSAQRVGKRCSMIPERRPGFHNGHTARAFKTGDTQIVTEIFSDVETLSWRTAARETGIVVSVPLPYKGSTIGVVNLFLPGITSVSESRIKLLESIAAAVTPAIENVRLSPISEDEIPRAA